MVHIASYIIMDPLNQISHRILTRYKCYFMHMGALILRYGSVQCVIFLIDCFEFALDCASLQFCANLASLKPLSFDIWYIKKQRI